MIKNYLNFIPLLIILLPQASAQESPAGPAAESGSAARPAAAAHAPHNEPPVKRINLIPLPVNLETAEGSFLLGPGVKIALQGNQGDLRELASFFSEMLAQAMGYRLPLEKTGDEAGRRIRLILNETSEQLTGKEGYHLQVQPEEILIRANEAAGLFYGMQTLMQLLPPEIESREPLPGQRWEIPCVRITDFPRFQWRGLMLDVSRHFFPVPFIKKYIDQMVKYKMNVFHWHLTDDQGWRIEIKSLPKLTSVGAWRVPRTGTWWERDVPKPGETPSYGGFYTQDEIREVVEYAEKRFVTILPEIDVPGHCLAAIAAYPEYACAEDNYYVNPGSKFYGKMNNTLCAGNEGTYAFMDKVLSEVAQLFPGKYIHIGGDEAHKGFWRKCLKCQQKMRQEGLQHVDQLQSYFIKRMQQILHAKGKKLVGWDEIMQGGLASGATVMSWRGMQGGQKAASMGHPVIMTPKDHCYLDLYQGDPNVEPPTYSMLRLTDSYHFNPLPEGVRPELVLGAQGNLWTESVPNPRHAEYMTWPRGLALAEVFWSPQERRQWNDFIGRMEAHFKRFDMAKVKYSESAYDPIITPVWGPGKKEMLITLRAEIPGVEIYYTFDGTWPDNHMDQYLGEPLQVPADADTFRVVSYKNGEQVGKIITYSIANLYGRLPAPM